MDRQIIVGLVTGIAIGTSAMWMYSRLTKVVVENTKTKHVDNEMMPVRCPNNIERMFEVSTGDLYAIVEGMIVEMKEGLQRDNSSNLKMIPSFVHYMPNGHETGKFLALDLGGSNFRVLTLELDGKGGCETQSKKFVIPEALMIGSGDQLFDFIADCLDSFVNEYGVDEINLPLGFTFSFPVLQRSLSSGELVQWTKGFSASGVQGHDVVSLLQNAVARKGLAVNVVALVNDTVGTMMARCLNDSECFVGLILGTGTNACYLEDLCNVPKFATIDNKDSADVQFDDINTVDGEIKSSPSPTPPTHVVINMEWGDFDREKRVLPSNRYDAIVDSESLNPGQQIFEKMISGMYLGELTRLVCVDLSVEGVLFGGRRSPTLEERWSFKTSFMSDIEEDTSDEMESTQLFLLSCFKIHSSERDRGIIRRICQLVSTRAAHLSAAGVVGVVTKADRLDSCTVAVDGTVFQRYPYFEQRMRDALYSMLGDKSQGIRFMRSEDGSGKGAATIAAVAADHNVTNRTLMQQNSS